MLERRPTWGARSNLASFSRDRSVSAAHSRSCPRAQADQAARIVSRSGQADCGLSPMTRRKESGGSESYRGHWNDEAVAFGSPATRSLTAPLDSGYDRCQEAFGRPEFAMAGSSDATQATYAPLGVYLMVSDGYGACEFYKRAFGADVTETYPWEGKLAHATLRINGGEVMLSDEFPEETTGVRSPTSLGGTTASVSPTVDDADRWFARSAQARP